MTEKIELLKGVYLSSLDTGSAVDLETRSRHYRLEYLEGDRIRISGHPQWCPTPVLARLYGSTVRSGELEEGYIGCGMRLVFERLDNHIPITTSEITDIRVVDLH
jgi:hypothetical protein